MALNNDLLQDFKRMTRYDLELYLLGVEELSRRYYPGIVAYYRGRDNRVPSLGLKLLDSLVDESKRLDYIIGVNVSRFETTDWWDLLEILEDVKTKLRTMQNTPKWARTSLIRAKIAINPSSEVQLSQGQTIERLLGGNLGYKNEHQDWYDIAIHNDLREEDYSLNGGDQLTVAASGGFAFTINSIVDIMDRETMKGKDIDRKITWENDDIKVLSGDDAFIQDMEILATLRKGDNPEFISNGLSKEVAVGQNINSISYPLLMRQINETFRRDDSIDRFAVTKIERVQDGVFIEMEIYAKSREVFMISKVL